MNAQDGISPEIAEVDRIVARVRTAQTAYENRGSQALYDKAALAAGWAIMEPTRNRALRPFLKPSNAFLSFSVSVSNSPIDARSVGAL